MKIATDQLTRLAEELANSIQAIDTDPDSLPFIRQIMICVELDMGDHMDMITSSSDDRKWNQIAFLDHAATHLETHIFSPAYRDEDNE